MGRQFLRPVQARVKLAHRSWLIGMSTKRRCCSRDGGTVVCRPEEAIAHQLVDMLPGAAAPTAFAASDASPAVAVAAADAAADAGPPAEADIASPETVST